MSHMGGTLREAVASFYETKVIKALRAFAGDSVTKAPCRWEPIISNVFNSVCVTHFPRRLFVRGAPEFLPPARSGQFLRCPWPLSSTAYRGENTSRPGRGRGKITCATWTRRDIC